MSSDSTIGARLGSRRLLKDGRKKKKQRSESRRPKARKAATKRKPAKKRREAESPRRRKVVSRVEQSRKPARRKAARKSPKTTRRANTPKPPRTRSVRSVRETPIPKVRIRLVFAFVILGFVAVLGRAAQLQLLQGEDYRGRANRQATGLSKVVAKRGTLVDRHGAELATTVDVDSVFAQPRVIKDKQAAAVALAPILGQSVKRIAKRLDSKKHFVYLARRVDAQVATRVRALGLAGVKTQSEPKRFYPTRGLAAHVLGFTNREGEGKAGIERTLDGQLRGGTADIPGLRDALGQRVLSEGWVPESALEGTRVELTLDRSVQHAAEEALKEAVDKYSAKSGVAIVMEPRTGEVLALASAPSFNPNNLSPSKVSDRKNRAISAVYEPGSTLKMVTLAAALEEKVLNKNATLDCEGGKWKVGRRTIHDADHEYDELTMTEIFQKSSNICSAKIGFKLGRERLAKWIRNFGFMRKTGIELPGELSGLMRKPSTWSDVGLANIAFGQGVAVTPLQIVQAASLIANDGVLMPPRLVRATIDSTGERSPREIPEGERVLSSKTARDITEMMMAVTQEGGTAIKAAVTGFNVAGKTGTAQKIDPVTRGYSHELHIASFVGFVPAEKPEVAILVLIDEPQGSHYGGTVAGPAFRKIALSALSSRDLRPSDPAAQKKFLADVRAARRLPPAKGELAEAGPDEAPEPESSPPAALALEGALSSKALQLLGLDAPAEAKSAAEDPKSPSVASTSGRMPNLRGLEPAEVLHRLAEVRCDPVVTGTGRVTKQSPAAGVVIAPGSTCKVELSLLKRPRRAG